SGELDDGAAGLMAIRMRGGLGIVQDPNEAASPEMPQRAIQYAGADAVLSAADISELLITAACRTQLPRSVTEADVQDRIDKEAAQANLEHDHPAKQPGRPSAFACPDCHGVLWELDEGELMRFRCRVGHAYTAQTLNGAMSESSENALWAAMRALEEKAALLRRLAPKLAPRMAKNYEEEASGYDRHAD